CSLDKSINFYSSKETEKDKSTTNPTLIKNIVLDFKFLYTSKIIHTPIHP
ncbi:unnamed protein product, partial [Brassica rapa subsp. trilocularis]